MSTDPKQQSRLQHLIQMPPLPPVPELSSQMRDGNGLFIPFKKFDQQHQEWARQVGRTLQTAHQSVVQAAKAGQSQQTYADRGWAQLIRSGGYWWFTRSTTTRPNSAQIEIQVFSWRTTGYAQEVSLATFNGAIQPGQVWTETGAAPNSFVVRILSEGTEDTNGMIGGQPLFHLWAGSEAGTVPAVTDAVHTVVKRRAPNEYLVWLASDEEVNPASVENLHSDGLFVRLV